MLRPLVLLPLLGALTACGGDEIYACDFRNSSEERCQERRRTIPDPAGSTETVFQQTCEASGGGFLADGCPVEGRVVGCRLDGGGGGEEVTDWYYGAQTRDAVMGDCSGTIVDP